MDKIKIMSVDFKNIHYIVKIVSVDSKNVPIYLTENEPYYPREYRQAEKKKEPHKNAERFYLINST